MQTFVTTVIETKPPATISPVQTEILPSKTVVKQTEKSKAPSSSIQIVGVEKAAPVINVVNPVKSVPVVASKVEFHSELQTKKSNVPFSPLAKKEVYSKVEAKVEPSIEINMHTNVAPSHVVENQEPVFSSIVEIHSSDDEEHHDEPDNDEEEDNHEDGDFDDEEDHEQEQVPEEDQPLIQIGNNIGEPEYDFLSRQPAEYVEETYRVHNIRPSTSSGGKAFHHKPRPTVEARKINNKKEDTHPTGLVTKLGGTVVKDGVTTVHETSVIGTYISGKYAQVLQSTSQIFQSNSKPKPTPASSLRILKTAPPTIPKNNRHYNLEPTPTGNHAEETAALPIEAIYSNNNAPNLVRSSRRPANPSGSFKNRFRNRNNNGKDESDVHDVQEEAIQVTPTTKISTKTNRRAGSKSKK